MTDNFEDRELVRRVLLGSASPEEAHQVTWRIAADAPYREQAEILEDELIDDFLRERLTFEDRRLFESHYLVSEEHRRKLDESRILLDVLDRRMHPKVRSPWRVLAIAGVAVGIIFGVLWFKWPRPLTSASLQAGMTRSEGTQEVVRIHPGVLIVKLELRSDSVIPPTHAVLRNARTGDLVLHEKVSSIDPVPTVEVPASLLESDRYILFLEKDGQRTASFSFLVSKH